MKKIIAFADACVLYPAPIRDLLMESAVSDLLQLKWSKKVLGEWIENLLINRPDLERTRVENTASMMNKAILDVLVDGYEPLESSLNLPDPNDRHVLAAAITAKSNYIITINLKDFPQNYLDNYKIMACHPDDLFCLLAKRNPSAFLKVVKQCLCKLKKPPKTLDQYILNLKEKCNLLKTATFIEENKKLLR